MKELAPEIEKLKKKYGKDKQAFAKAQLELYKKHGANPAAGCLPQIIQLLVLIALFQAFNQVLTADGDVVLKLNQVLYSALKLPEATKINTGFFYLDLTQPDVFQWGKLKIPGFFLVGAALIQFFSSKIMSPALKGSEKMADKTPGGMDDMAVAMQKQMVFLLPIMTVIIGFTFPSGLVIYWLVFSLTTLGQQLIINRSR